VVVITADRVLQELALIGFGDVGQVMDFSGPAVRLRPANQISEAARRSIASMKCRRYTEGRGDDAREVEVTEFKLWDKLEALQKMGQHLGLFPTRHELPEQWSRFVGIDFGGVNTAAVFYAAEQKDGKPTGRLYAYREYKAGERSAAEHIYHLMKGEPRIPYCVGGSKSEGQWRTEFAKGGVVSGKQVHGLPIRFNAEEFAQRVQGESRRSGRTSPRAASTRRRRAAAS
jgi:Terminase small subunit